jgi:tRNA(Ile)-lysidine synthase
VPQQRLTQQVAAAFLPRPPDQLGVAVSGGGDSMALLNLLHALCALHGSKLRVVTVDHGLRAAAAAEARMVTDVCAGLGLRHDVLVWDGWDGQGNLQDAARRARYALMADWGRANAIDTIAVGHTADDQAETLLMRLARRAGVDGLAGMKRRLVMEGMTWVRPLLGATRADLRDYLVQRDIPWIEDPSNEDEVFERIKARKMLDVLAPLGITVEGLSEIADNMYEARKALEWQSFLAARDIIHIDAGAVVVDDRSLRLLPDEIQRRLLVRAMNWISGDTYPARRKAVQSILHGLRRGQAGTAEGCHARRVGGAIWVFREFNQVSDLRCDCGALWDGRWRLWPADPDTAVDDVVIRALGEDGLAQCPQWRTCGRPHPVLLSTPSVWRDDVLLAAPLAGAHQNWHAEVDGGEETFFAALLTQ